MTSTRNKIYLLYTLHLSFRQDMVRAELGKHNKQKNTKEEKRQQEKEKVSKSSKRVKSREP